MNLNQGKVSEFWKALFVYLYLYTNLYTNVNGRQEIFMFIKRVWIFKKLNIAFRAQEMIYFVGLIQNLGVGF